jgi:hypothetical protein
MSRPLTVQTNLTPDDTPDDLAKIAKKEPNPRVRQRLLAPITYRIWHLTDSPTNPLQIIQLTAYTSHL